MATVKKTVKKKKFEMPKEGDKTDLRCAFTKEFDGPDKHDKVSDEVWCYGCNFYVCGKCKTNFSLMSSHDVMEHKVDEFGDEEAEE